MNYVEISGASEFEIIEQPSIDVIPDRFMSPGNNFTTFKVKLFLEASSDSEGTYEAQITIPNNDIDENLYTFTVRGRGIIKPFVDQQLVPLSTMTDFSPNASYMRFDDFNGDGKTDYMWIPTDHHDWYIAYATEDGFTEPQLAVKKTNIYAYSTKPFYMHFGDFNGDGMTDYMWIPWKLYDWYIAYGTGDGFTQPEVVLPKTSMYLHSPNISYTKFGDFNGDGKTDYMWIPWYLHDWYVTYATDNGFTEPQMVVQTKTNFYAYSTSSLYIKFADFNGDGKTDYMWIPTNHHDWYIAYATEDGFAEPQMVLQTETNFYAYSTSDLYMHLVDFNGDGKTDYMWIPTNHHDWYIVLGTEDGFTEPEIALSKTDLNMYVYSPNGSYMHFSDFNEDNRIDYMWIPWYLYDWHIAYGNSFF